MAMITFSSTLSAVENHSLHMIAAKPNKGKFPSTGHAPPRALQSETKPRAELETTMLLAHGLVVGVCVAVAVGVTVAVCVAVGVAVCVGVAVAVGVAVTVGVAVGLVRDSLREMHGGPVADTARILYGGSTKPDNIRAIMQQPQIDGALIGSASIVAERYAEMVKITSDVYG